VPELLADAFAPCGCTLAVLPQRQLLLPVARNS
jgi:hypothetical protein